MYLDQRFNTRWSNHTNGIQDINYMCICMQSAWLQSSYFNATSTVKWQLINNGLSIASVSAIPPPVWKGNRSLPPPSPTQDCIEKPWMVSLCIVFSFFLPLQMISHCSIVQLNHYSIADVDCPPSVFKGNKRRACCRHPLPLNCLQKAEVVWLPLCFPFLHYSHYSHHGFFQMNCYFDHGTNHLSSVHNKNKRLLLQSPASKWHAEGSNGEFGSPFPFSLNITKSFDHWFISTKLLFCC